MSYRTARGDYGSLGLEYMGKNNPYYQPPFAILDFQFRQPIAPSVDLSISVQNLLNTNSYNYLAAPNLGVPAVGNYTTPTGKVEQGSYATYLIPAATRTFRASMRVHVGK